jgi:hypothetical protein
MRRVGVIVHIAHSCPLAPGVEITYMGAGAVMYYLALTLRQAGQRNLGALGFGDCW